MGTETQGQYWLLLTYDSFRLHSMDTVPLELALLQVWRQYLRRNNDQDRPESLLTLKLKTRWLLRIQRQRINLSTNRKSLD
jgi:hypothetical protein